MKLTTFAPTGTPIHMSKWRYTPQILATNHTKKKNKLYLNGGGLCKPPSLKHTKE